MRILEERLSAAVKILICEISRRDDKTSSCNHDMDLVIGGVSILLGRLVTITSPASGAVENKHKGLRNKGNILRSG